MAEKGMRAFWEARPFLLFDLGTGPLRGLSL